MTHEALEEQRDYLASLIRTVTTALLADDEATARQLLARLQQGGASLQLLYEQIIHPVLRTVGEAWEQRLLRVDQEHLITGRCRQVMAQLALSTTLTPPPPSAPLLIAACPPGELHDVGLRMLADCAPGAGWRVHYLGADVPIDALLSSIADQRPAAIALSITMREHLLAAQAGIQEIRAAYGPGLHILVGGQAVQTTPDVPRALGADASAASLDGALGLLAALAGSRTTTDAPVPTPRVEVASPETLLAQRLLAAQRTAGMAVATALAHELNNPLAIALGETTLLREERPHDTELHELLGRIDTQHRRMAEIVRFLASYRQEPPIWRREAALETCVERGIAQARHDLQSAGLPVGEVTVVVTPVQAWVDAEQIVEAVAAVVRNALEASPRDCPVEVRLARHDIPHGLAWACIEVRDWGRGMSPDEQRRAFIPFTSGKPAAAGVGRGLAAAEGAMVRHGGQLTLARDPEGGMLAHLWLPLTASPALTNLDHAAAISLARRLEAHAPALEAAVLADLAQRWPGLPMVYGADGWRAGAVRRLQQQIQVALRLGLPQLLMAEWEWGRRVLPGFGVPLGQLTDLGRAYVAAVDDQLPLEEGEAAIVRQLAVWLGDELPPEGMPTASQRRDELQER